MPSSLVIPNYFRNLFMFIVVYDFFSDRNTAIGGLINDYLKKNIDLTDKAIHLLFSANRWEKE